MQGLCLRWQVGFAQHFAQVYFYRAADGGYRHVVDRILKWVLAARSHYFHGIKHEAYQYMERNRQPFVLLSQLGELRYQPKWQQQYEYPHEHKTEISVLPRKREVLDALRTAL